MPSLSAVIGDRSKVVVHGKVHAPAQLPGFGIFDGGVLLALITYELDADRCEIVALDRDRPGRGFGTQLLESVLELAGKMHLRRVWLVTTNDNLDRLGFYQKRGFVLSALRPGAVEQSRRLKPEIPIKSPNGITIRDELELHFCEGEG